MSRYRIRDLSKFPDCYALSEQRRCTWLTVYNCQGEECTFKRTSKEEIDSLQYAYQCLASLDISMQKQITKKYYGGSMYWNEAKTVKTYRAYKCLKSLNNKRLY